MSDSESFASTSKSRDVIARHPVDDVLNDHRQQRENLPSPEDLALDDHPRTMRPQADPSRHRRTHRSYSVAESISADDAAQLLRRGSRVSRNSLDRDVATITRHKTADSDMHPGHKRERRPSRTSVDSDADSHASRNSQETEEDVCFPMLREHVRVNGIDFDEIEEFIKDERDNTTSIREQTKILNDRFASPDLEYGKATGNSFSERGNSQLSNNASKYTPKVVLSKMKAKYDDDEKKDSSVRGITTEKRPESESSDDYWYDRTHQDDSSENGVKFGGAKINEDNTSLPERFSFFHSDNEETVHAPDMPSLVVPGQTVQELFKNGDGTWWLDVTCPTDAEVKTLAKAFGIHPLTAEDIRMQETREKVELFRNYYFVCFHSFESDKESEDYLEPINFYIVVFREGVLTFHFAPVPNPANVRRRVRQLREYVDVNADWLCYAMIDDITDGFAPVITGIEYEADAVEDCVLTAQEMNFSSMLRKIGEARRKVMTLMRLLSNKADVIKMFAKRCQDENLIQQAARLNLNGINGLETFSPPPPRSGGQEGTPQPYYETNKQQPIAQPRADIALYLGDIQDHVLTMYQNLSAYEKIFSRSHGNYLAQLQVESFNANLRVTEILGNVTMLGTLILPMNTVFSAFGMNVKVPGQDGPHLGWFFGIVGTLLLFVGFLFFLVSYILKKHEKKLLEEEDDKRSLRSFGTKIKSRSRDAAKSIISFPKGYE